MKNLIWVLILLSAAVAAQQPQTAPQPSPTVADLQVKVADQAAEIARLRAQVSELDYQLRLYESASGAARRRGEDQQAIQRADAEAAKLHAERAKQSEQPKAEKLKNPK